ncbi:MAG: DUF1292 domain-containing protein [Bacilli bacterium]|nr:DUF1292 domain-containing protein [Bacilli bacterium]
MDYKNLSFMVEGELCDILEVIPINGVNYVTFTNYDLDESEEFLKYYGRVDKKNDEYLLTVINDEETIKMINEKK